MRCSFVRSADDQRGPAHAHDRRRRFESNRVWGQLRDPSGDVCRHALDDVEDEPETAFSRRVGEAVETDFAARSERQAGIVLQGESHTPVGAGPERIGFVDRPGRPAPGSRTRANDDYRARSDLDPAGSRGRLLETPAPTAGVAVASVATMTRASAMIERVAFIS